MLLCLRGTVLTPSGYRTRIRIEIFVVFVNLFFYVDLIVAILLGICARAGHNNA